MRKNHCEEYDNYKLPEQLKKETPETKEKLAKLYEEAKAMAARHHREAEEAEKKSA